MKGPIVFKLGHSIQCNVLGLSMPVLELLNCNQNSDLMILFGGASYFT